MSKSTLTPPTTPTDLGGVDNPLRLEHKADGVHGRIRWRIAGELGVFGDSVGQCSECGEDILEGQTSVTDDAPIQKLISYHRRDQLRLADLLDSAPWAHIACTDAATLSDWAGRFTPGPKFDTITPVRVVKAVAHPRFEMTIAPARTMEATAPKLAKAVRKAHAEGKICGDISDGVLRIPGFEDGAAQAAS